MNAEEGLFGKGIFDIVGLRYCKAKASPGDIVHVVREPSNRFDKNAIRVNNFRGEQVGYIRGETAKSLAAYMDSREIVLEASIPEGRQGNAYQLPVQLKFYSSLAAEELQNLIKILQNKLSPSFDPSSDSGSSWEGALIIRASRDMVKFGHTTHFYCRKRGEGCRCIKAKYEQFCQSCKKPIKMNDCITKYVCGYCHTECNENEKLRGLPTIQAGYNEVHYNDDYLKLEGNSTSSGDLLLVKCGDEPRTMTQENTWEYDSGDAESPSYELRSDRPAVVTGTPKKRKQVKPDGTSLEKRARCIPPTELFPEGGNETDQEDDDTEGHETEDDEEEDQEEEEEEEEETSNNKETKEQRRILDYEPQKGEVVPVNALAGCGKTTIISLLCNQYCENNKNRVLYLVYNKKNQEEASQSNKFPKDVETRTTHSCVLHHYFGTTNMHKINGIDKHDLKEIEDQAGLYTDCKSLFPELESKANKAFQRIIRTVASFVRKTVKKFLASDDARVKKSHVFWRATLVGSTKRTAWKSKISPMRYVQWAQKVFDHSHELCKLVKQGRTQGKVAITYDTYLKVAELDDNFKLPHDVIFLDEAQDMTPCQASLFWGERRREGKIIYLFGDKYQQLYRFRGASRSFGDILQKYQKMSLTGSFRFGQNIAAYASYILQAVGATDSVQGRAVNPGKVRHETHINTKRSLVVLCRSNQGIFRYLLENRPKKWSSLGFKLPPKQPKSFVIQLEDFLWGRKTSFDYKMEKFTSPIEIEEFAEDEGDSELKRYFKLLSYLKEKKTSIEMFFKQIRSSYCELDGKSPDDCNDRVVIDTVHKAKGLEFNNVLINNDFNFEVVKKAANLNGDVTHDEANIVYVAVTRAKECLFLTDEAHEFFEELKKTVGALPEIQEMSEDLSGTREQLFIDWEELKDSEAPINSLEDIPWPPEDTLGFDREMDESEYRSYAKALILTYHPDKFKQKFGQRCCSQDVYEEVQAEMARVFMVANRLKQEERGWEV